jgi:hypothetical protein
VGGDAELRAVSFVDDRLVHLRLHFHGQSALEVIHPDLDEGWLTGRGLLHHAPCLVDGRRSVQLIRVGLHRRCGRGHTKPSIGAVEISARQLARAHVLLDFVKERSIQP